MERIDRYIDSEASQSGNRSNRNDFVRRAVAAWLDEHEPSLSRAETEKSTPQYLSDRDAFISAYYAAGTWRSFVRIHSVREYLGWSRERFDIEYYFSKDDIPAIEKCINDCLEALGDHKAKLYDFFANLSSAYNHEMIATHLGIGVTEKSGKRRSFRTYFKNPGIRGCLVAHS